MPAIHIDGRSKKAKIIARNLKTMRLHEAASNEDSIIEKDLAIYLAEVRGTVIPVRFSGEPNKSYVPDFLGRNKNSPWWSRGASAKDDLVVLNS